MSNSENMAFSRFVSCFIISICDSIRTKGEKWMDTKKIGEFLKVLRKEKGLTQERLAEVLHVSGRTVSRWETGTNMPDLSILIQIAEFYNVEVKEILDGERKSEIMDKELKETLSKVADYNKLEKEKAIKAGNVAFGLTFAVCVVMIIVQLIATGDLAVVAGETAVLLVGGVAYIGIITYNGIWETGSRFKSTLFTDALISVICAGIFAVVLAVRYIRLGAAMSQMVHIALIFFVGIAGAGFTILRILAYFSHKRKNGIVVCNESIGTREQQPVNVFIADGNIQAEMIIRTLKDSGIMAYGQDLGDAGFASVRYGMGRGIDDRVAIIVAGDKVNSAMQVIKEMGLK